MRACLETAATKLYENPMRLLAGTFSYELSDCVANLLRDSACGYAQYFDITYSSVSGSTHRGTHLPNDLDFDIGLLPLKGVNWREPFSDLVKELGQTLASNPHLCATLSKLFDVDIATVETSLRNPLESEIAKELRYFEFRLERPDRSMIEVCAGFDAWHLVHVHYNTGWKEQFCKLSPKVQKRTISHVCLMKFLAKRFNVYGGQAGGPDSRGYEQLVIRHANTQSPIESLMREMLKVDALMNSSMDRRIKRILQRSLKVDCLQQEMYVDTSLDRPRDSKKVVPYPISDDAWSDAGKRLEQNNVMRAFSVQSWRKFMSLARAVLNEA